MPRRFAMKIFDLIGRDTLLHLKSQPQFINLKKWVGLS